MALVRNAVGIVADVSDAEAGRLNKRGWESLEAPTQSTSASAKRAPRKRAAAKSEAPTEEQD